MPNRTPVVQNEPEQTSWLPEERYTPEPRLILMENVEGAVLEPGADFVANIRRVGLLNPITVIQQTRSRYRLVAGRRRLAAMRAVNADGHINAMVFPAGTPLAIASSMALSENTQRRPNPLTDLQAIEQLIAAGANEEIISRELHLPIATIRSRMRLQALIPALREALEGGNISPSVAERAARLSRDRQTQLAGLLDVNGRITGEDVGNAMRVGQNEQVEAMPDEVFTPTTQTTMIPIPGDIDNIRHEVPDSPSWASVLHHVTRAEALMPAPSNADMETVAAWLHDLAELVNAIIRAGTP